MFSIKQISGYYGKQRTEIARDSSMGSVMQIIVDTKQHAYGRNPMPTVALGQD